MGAAGGAGEAAPTAAVLAAAGTATQDQKLYGSLPGLLCVQYSSHSLQQHMEGNMQVGAEYVGKDHGVSVDGGSTRQRSQKHQVKLRGTS